MEAKSPPPPPPPPPQVTFTRPHSSLTVRPGMKPSGMRSKRVPYLLMQYLHRASSQKDPSLIPRWTPLSLDGLPYPLMDSLSLDGLPYPSMDSLIPRWTPYPLMDSLSLDRFPYHSMDSLIPRWIPLSLDGLPYPLMDSLSLDRFPYHSMDLSRLSTSL